MSDATVSAPQPGCTQVVNPAEIQAHIEKVKAAWRAHERQMTWEEKVAAIERMWERDAQLARARERLALTLGKERSATK